MTTQRTRNPGAFGEVLEELMRARDLEPYPENGRRREGRREEAQGGRPMLVTADGSKVRALREARESSTREFAKKAGVSRRTLTRVERNEGPVRPGTARKIGSALEVDPRTFARAVSSRPAWGRSKPTGSGILRVVPALYREERLKGLAGRETDR